MKAVRYFARGLRLVDGRPEVVDWTIAEDEAIGSSETRMTLLRCAECGREETVVGILPAKACPNRHESKGAKI